MNWPHLLTFRFKTPVLGGSTVLQVVQCIYSNLDIWQVHRSQEVSCFLPLTFTDILSLKLF